MPPLRIPPRMLHHESMAIGTTLAMSTTSAPQESACECVCLPARMCACACARRARPPAPTGMASSLSTPGMQYFRWCCVPRGCWLVASAAQCLRAVEAGTSSIKRAGRPRYLSQQPMHRHHTSSCSFGFFAGRIVQFNGMAKISLKTVPRVRSPHPACTRHLTGAPKVPSTQAVAPPCACECNLRLHGAGGRRVGDRRDLFVRTPTGTAHHARPECYISTPAPLQEQRKGL